MTVHKKEFPILEFDDNHTSVLEPSGITAGSNVSEYCVISFFRNAINRLIENEAPPLVYTFCSETVDLPVWELKRRDHRICLVQGYVGSAGAAGLLEELIALGCRKFIVCGGAGVLQKDIAVGRLIVPYAAVRDEGASYHYLPPSREVMCNSDALTAIEAKLSLLEIPFLRAKTWTTDAIYRETREKVALRASEGCVSVEMEAAAFFAVSAFRGVTLGQILYAGDDLSGAEWDGRKWNSRNEIRDNLLNLSLEICLDL